MLSAQQCIEKYLKACLQERGIPYGRTHDLSALLDLLLPVEPTWFVLRPALRTLSVYAVDYRYPGVLADKAMAREANKLCRDLRSRFRTALGL